MKSIAEKVRDKEPLTREEFKSLADKTDWEDYRNRVINRVSEIADRHDEVIRLSKLSRHVYC